MSEEQETASPEYVEFSLGSALDSCFPGETAGEGLKLCLGSGSVAPDNWICLDSRRDYPPLARKRLLEKGFGKGKCNVMKLDWIPEKSCKYVYAHHVIEHMKDTDWKAAIELWASKVADDGFLYLAAPDLLAIAARLCEGSLPGSMTTFFETFTGYTYEGDTKTLDPIATQGPDSAWYYLYAGGEHKSVATGAQVRAVLEDIGFEVKRWWQDPMTAPGKDRQFICCSFIMVARRIVEE